MAKIIHPDETDEKAEKSYEVIASFKPDDATEEHQDDLFMAEEIDDRSENYWQEEKRKREERHDVLCKELDTPIPTELLKQRKAPGQEGRDGKMLTYATWHAIVRRLNQFFGHDGWTTEERSTKTFGEEGGSAPKFVATVVRLTVRWPNGGTSTFTNVGTGVNSSGNWYALEMAYKDAFHDGIKRCATALGDAFALGLYDGDVEVVETTSSTETQTPSSARTPTPIRRGPAPSFPVATEDEVAACETCGKEIKGYTAKTGKVYSTADLVGMSQRFADGHTFCYDCKNNYLNAKKA